MRPGRKEASARRVTPSIPGMPVFSGVLSLKVPGDGSQDVPVVVDGRQNGLIRLNQLNQDPTVTQP